MTSGYRNNHLRLIWIFAWTR